MKQSLGPKMMILIHLQKPLIVSFVFTNRKFGSSENPNAAVRNYSYPSPFHLDQFKMIIIVTLLSSVKMIRSGH